MEAIKSYHFDMVPKPTVSTVKLLSPLIRARTLPEILSEKYSTRKLSPARKNPKNAGKISGCRQKEIKDEIIYGLTILIHPPQGISRRRFNSGPSNLSLHIQNTFFKLLMLCVFLFTLALPPFIKQNRCQKLINLKCVIGIDCTHNKTLFRSL